MGRPRPLSSSHKVLDEPSYPQKPKFQGGHLSGVYQKATKAEGGRKPYNEIPQPAKRLETRDQGGASELNRLGKKKRRMMALIS